MGYLRNTEALEKNAFFSKLWEKAKTNLGNMKDAATNLVTGKGSLRDLGSTMTGGAIAASKPDTNIKSGGGAGSSGGGGWLSKAWNVSPLGMMTNLFKNSV